MKVVQTSLSESVTQHLAGRIMRGELSPGLSLPGENELAAEYDVSRTSIRNALATLATKGLISILTARYRLAAETLSLTLNTADGDASFLRGMTALRARLQEFHL